MSESENLAKKIKDKLQIGEQTITDDFLDKAKKLIGITSDGKIIFKINRSHISVADQILLLLAGVRLAYEAKIRESSAITLEEVAEALQINRKIASARLTELIGSYRVSRKTRGSYAISDYALHEVINRLASGPLND